MFDHLYTQMTARVNYKVLMVLPWIFTLLLVAFTYYHGIPLGMDFKGGTWMDVLTDAKLDSAAVSSLTADLTTAGLEEPRVTVGQDLESSKTEVTIATGSFVNKTFMKSIVMKYLPDLRDIDIATVPMAEKPPGWLEFRLSSRLNEPVNLTYENGILQIAALDLNAQDLDSILSYSLGQNYNVTLNKKNFNLKEVGPTLGQTFRQQGEKAIMLSFVLMGIVVFISFKVFVPSLAVLEAGICDVLIAVGGMSIFGIPFDSPSLGALLMLIGYSVDTDILLTMRVLKQKPDDVGDAMDASMKTGLMMTATTIGAMGVTIFVTTFLIQIPTLNSIATVLMFGLIADIFTTWWTNTGLLRWYLSSPRHAVKKKAKFSLFKE
jgi:preprotein translocase subunit SecF